MANANSLLLSPSCSRLFGPACLPSNLCILVCFFSSSWCNHWRYRTSVAVTIGPCRTSSHTTSSLKFSLFPVSMCQSMRSPSWTYSLRTMLVNKPSKKRFSAFTAISHFTPHITGTHTLRYERLARAPMVRTAANAHTLCMRVPHLLLGRSGVVCHVHSLTELCALALSRLHSRQSNSVSPHLHWKTMRHQADPGASYSIHCDMLRAHDFCN